MTTVRISSNWGHPDRVEWCGAPALAADNHIERSTDLPEEAYEKIEAGIGHGYVEGTVFLDDGSKVCWYLDGRRAVPQNRLASPQPAVAETKPVRRPAEAGPMVDVAGRPGPGQAMAPGDFESGFVLAEFPVATPKRRTPPRKPRGRGES
jgi:hypothetical protein